MDIVWMLLGVAFLAVLAIAFFEALVSEPGVEGVHVTREAVQLGLAIAGLVAYVLLTGEHLTWRWAIVMSVAGIAAGYGTAWAAGHDALSGIAIVPGSRSFAIIYLGSAVVSLAGSLGLGIHVLALGLLGYYGSVAFGIGRSTYRFMAAQRAALVYTADVHVALNRACAECGASIILGDRYCRACGAEQPTVCSSCGEPLPPGSSACPTCRTAVVDPPAAPLDPTWVRTCLVCATPLSPDVEFCPTCGVQATPACDHCGGPALPAELDCPVCGIDLEVAAVVAADDAALRSSTPTECRDCAATNRPGSRFCTTCGSELG